ncbi:hypothetical protein BU26DRAFT_84228 [Trematosphaeria pertusa]|uniref:Uncharacterized protein n=1 Tax=Trematosphaeria pertusa TaxID=390896 RepID=A0A6A6I413_9PLEO|nr:uncharacterized protein BU26DRAFT_84228 [Trematosphaeria pertusa]KAF2244682.1 hypothetical protein BU26DRAFT_84228 [Trematosphaeria pertusa]
MPFWGSAFRVSFVYFNSLRTEYSPVCAARSLLQVAFVISVNVLSIFAALLLFPPWEGRLLSSSFWSGLAGQGEDIRHADDDFMQLPRASQERIRNLNHWCGALVSWHLIAIALPALACCMFSVMDGCIRRRMQHHYLCTNRPPSDRNTTTH